MNRAWLVAAALGFLATQGGAVTSEAAVTPEAAATPEKSVLMRAMQDELDRSMRELKLERMVAPYFMAYRVDAMEGTSASAVFGALTHSDHSDEGYYRRLIVEMRIGSAELDNTNFLPTRLWDSPLTRSFLLPRDDDYQELRRQIWLATDIAYKHALATLAQKRAALQNRRREEIPDFAAQEPHVSRVELPAKAPGVAEVAELARGLSGVFRDMPHVHDSRVSAEVTDRRSYYLNSEGTSYLKTRPTVEVAVLAKTQAEDGTVLQDFEVVHERAWQELPSQEELARRVRALGDSLAARRQAEALARYSGPVLFVGQAAAELVAQALAPRFLAVRVPIADGSMGNFATADRKSVV